MIIKIDTLNLWYSAGINKWCCCILWSREDGLFVRERKTFVTFDEALQYIWALKK